MALSALVIGYGSIGKRHAEKQEAGHTREQETRAERAERRRRRRDGHQ